MTRYIILFTVILSVSMAQIPTTGIFPASKPISNRDRIYLIKGNLGLLYAGTSFEIRYGYGNRWNMGLQFNVSYVSSPDWDDFDYSVQPSVGFTLARRYNWVNHKLISYYSPEITYIGAASTIGRWIYAGGVIKLVQYTSILENEEHYEITRDWIIDRYIYGFLVGVNTRSGFQGEIEAGFGGRYNKVPSGYYNKPMWLQDFYIQITVGKSFGGNKSNKEKVKYSALKNVIQRKHAIYLEVFGNGIFASANYEYRWRKKLALRVGVGFGPLALTTPIMFNYLVGEGPNKLELGFGIVGIPIADDWAMDTGVFKTGTIGYRYHPIEKGMIIRIGVTPFVEPNQSGGYTIIPSLGMSIGYQFIGNEIVRVIGRFKK